MYVVDIVCDGQQVFDSGIIPDRGIADKAYDLIRANELPDIPYPVGIEYEVREIHNGEIRASATILDGKVLAAISAR